MTESQIKKWHRNMRVTVAEEIEKVVRGLQMNTGLVTTDTVDRGARLEYEHAWVFIEAAKGSKIGLVSVWWRHKGTHIIHRKCYPTAPNVYKDLVNGNLTTTVEGLPILLPAIVHASEAPLGDAVINSMPNKETQNA